MSVDPAARSAYDRRWLILAVILAAECMDLLDATIVNVAAPSINTELGTTSAQLQWIVGGYALAVAVGLITGARLGDLYGRGRMFLVGTAGFTLASLLCGLAPTTGSLIGFRLLQGAAAALMLPQGFGIIREVFGDDLQKAFGVFGPVIGSAAVLGPIIGGALVDLDLGGWGWRTIFFVNVPLGLAAMYGAWRLLPVSKSAYAAKLDVVGAVLTGIGAICLVYPLIQGREYGWPAWCFAMMGLSVVIFGIFALQQRSRLRAGADPLILPSIFTHRGYSAGMLVLVVFFAGMSGILLTVSVFLQSGEGFSPTHAGVTFIPMSLGLAIGSALSGAVLGVKFGRKVIQAGGVVTMVGWLLVIVAVHSGASADAVELIPGLLIAGLGMGLCVAPLFDIVLASVTDEETGSASGLLNAGQQLAGSLGVAVLGTIFFSALDGGDFADALEKTMWAQIASLVVMLVLTPLLPRFARDPAAAPGAAPESSAEDSPTIMA